MALVVYERDKTFSLKKISQYDLQALINALWDGSEDRGKEGYGERLAELAQLLELAQKGSKYGERIFKEE